MDMEGILFLSQPHLSRVNKLAFSPFGGCVCSKFLRDHKRSELLIFIYKYPEVNLLVKADA
jgi:hypothetical protein